MLPTEAVVYLLQFTKEKKNLYRLHIYLFSIPGLSPQEWELGGLVFGLGGPAHTVHCFLVSAVHLVLPQI